MVATTTITSTSSSPWFRRRDEIKGTQHGRQITVDGDITETGTLNKSGKTAFGMIFGDVKSVETLNR